MPAMPNRPTSELVQIANAGGGFFLIAVSRSTPELVQIASAARAGGARITFKGLTARSTAELVQIANAGQGAVYFED